jgi:hypothetical protein
MPWMHQHVGTPVLNFFINRLHAPRGTRITDCNSGFRCFRRAAFEQWQVRSTGMEFASEMLLKALRNGARIAEVPISLRRDERQRTPHLKRWRDGMRHLLQILMDAPHFFYYLGLVLFVLNWAVVVTSYLTGPVQVGFVWVFGIHTMMFALLGSCVAVSIWSVGLILSTRVASPLRVYRYLVDLSEDKLFWSSVAFFGLCALLFLGLVVSWGVQGFRFISLERQTLLVITLATNGLFLTLNVITAHLVKRT